MARRNTKINTTDVAFCKEAPHIVDHIQTDEVSIERMTEEYYWMRVGDRTFRIQAFIGEGCRPGTNQTRKWAKVEIFEV